MQADQEPGPRQNVSQPDDIGKWGKKLGLIVFSAEFIGGCALAAVALLITVEATLRYFFSALVPDAFFFAGILQGVAICWGISIAAFRKSHIAVDSFWSICPPGIQYLINLIANAFVLLFFAAWSLMFTFKVLDVRSSFEESPDLGLPLWAFLSVSCVGVFFGLFLSACVLLRDARRRDPSETAPVQV